MVLINMRSILVTMLITICAVLASCQQNVTEEWSYFDDMLATADDSKLCEDIYDLILYQDGKTFDPAKCNKAERVVFRVYHATGIIDNGGFQFLFEGSIEGDPYYAQTAVAFREAKLVQCVEAVEEALQLFPNSRPPSDRDNRLQIFQEAPQETRQAINLKFFNQSEHMTKFLATYIRENRKSLQHLSQ